MYVATKHYIEEYKKSEAFERNPTSPIPNHWISLGNLRGEHEENDYQYNGDPEGPPPEEGPTRFRTCVLTIAYEWFGEMNVTDPRTFPQVFLNRATIQVNKEQSLSKNQKKRIRKIAVLNGWYNQIVIIYRNGEEGSYTFQGHQLKRQEVWEDLKEKWLIENFKYKDPAFFNKLYNPKEKGPFHVPAGAARIVAARKRTKGAPTLFLQQNGTAGCVFCSLASGLFAYGDIVSANIFKTKLQASLDAHDRMQFAVDVATNSSGARAKGEPHVHLMVSRWTESAKYNPLTNVSPLPTLLRLRDMLDGISHCVTTVGNYVFDSNVPFALPLTLDTLNECCTDPHLPKGCNGYNGVYEAIRFEPTKKNRCVPNKLM